MSTADDARQAGSSALGLPRLLLAAVFLILGIAYVAAVVSGLIGKNQRLEFVDLALLGLIAAVAATLMTPRWLDRLKLFKLGAIEVELLERVREKQVTQDKAIEDISLILPLLLPQTERAHLLNIARGTTAGYRGGAALRAELRRLRSIGLIRMRDNRAIGALTSNLTFDLSDAVDLTSLGRRWVDRIREIEQAESGQPAEAARS